MPIGIDSSRSRVPLERSRSVVTLVTRNITMNGNIASSAGPNWSKTGVSLNIHHSKPDQHARQHEQQCEGAAVAAELGQHPAGDGER